MTSLALHGWYKSSCSGRLRIALGYKGIKYEPIYVDFPGKEHRSEAYAKINPSMSIPTLVVQQPGSSPEYITQSVAAMEWLEEVYPDTPPLLPAASKPLERARVRALVEILAGEIQPRTSALMIETVSALGNDPVQWARDFHARGLRAYEALIRVSAGRFSVGDAVTMADVCLAPVVWNTQRWGLTLDEFPTVQRVYDNLMAVDAFHKGHWNQQPDCPAEERAKA